MTGTSMRWQTGFPGQVGRQPGWPQWGEGQGPNQHDSGRGRRPRALATGRAELPTDGPLHLHLLEESHCPGGHSVCEGRQKSKWCTNREPGLLPDMVSSTQGLPLGSTTICSQVLGQRHCLLWSSIPSSLPAPRRDPLSCRARAVALWHREWPGIQAQPSRHRLPKALPGLPPPSHSHEEQHSPGHTGSPSQSRLFAE